MARSPSGRTKMTVNAVPTPGSRITPDTSTPPPASMSSTRSAARSAPTNPTNAVRRPSRAAACAIERAAPAQCQPRARDFALRLAEREHLGRAAHDHIRVRVADDDEVVAVGPPASPRRGGRRPSQPVR